MNDTASSRSSDSAQRAEILRQYLAKTLLVKIGDGAGQTRPDADLFASGLIDSFAFVQLVAFLEKQFKIKITDGEALSDALVSVAKIEAFIEKKVGGGGGR